MKQASTDSQAAQPAAATPEQTYQAWLTRQLAAYVAALFTLLAKRETPAGIQVGQHHMLHFARTHPASSPAAILMSAVDF